MYSSQIITYLLWWCICVLCNNVLQCSNDDDIDDANCQLVFKYQVQASKGIVISTVYTVGWQYIGSQHSKHAAVTITEPHQQWVMLSWNWLQCISQCWSSFVILNTYCLSARARKTTAILWQSSVNKCMHKSLYSTNRRSWKRAKIAANCNEVFAVIQT